jgi:hypothetical protein
MELGFPAGMQHMNPMLANWMNIHTDGFTPSAFNQQAMGKRADYGAAYGGQMLPGEQLL